MNLKIQLTRAFFISIVSAMGFGLVALMISSEKIAGFDQSIVLFVQNFNSPSVTELMKFFTFIGSGTAITVLVAFMMLLLYVVFKHRSELILLLGVLVGSALLNFLLKIIFHRARPDINRLIAVSGYSFPSGHSMAAFTMYGILSFLLWKHTPSQTGRVCLIIFSLLMIVLIGVSRIYLGVHYPSDVLGGFLASTTWLIFAIAAYQRYQKRKLVVRQ